MNNRKYVYVYHEACDGDAFGEMIFRVFATKEDAVSHLKSRVAEYCGEIDWKKCKKHIEENYEDATFNEDYVSFGPTSDGYCFWTIEKLPIEQ